MLTSTDRHFISNWNEQKSGPKWKFYLLFSTAWSVISFLVIFFLTKLFTNLWETGGQNLIFVLVSISIISGFLSTHFSYVINERRYKKILQENKEEEN
ncbi:MAG: hypothetical protein ABIR03_10190 [Ginsengibacter sp.]